MQGKNNNKDLKRDVVTETGSKRFYAAGCEDAKEDQEPRNVGSL